MQIDVLLNSGQVLVIEHATVRDADLGVWAEHMRAGNVARIEEGDRFRVLIHFGRVEAVRVITDAP